jgi:hypothetical protein
MRFALNDGFYSGKLLALWMTLLPIE